MIIMKRLYFVFLLVAGSFGTCFAQSYKEAIQKDPSKAAGTFYVYDSAALPAPTPAPEGYEPFYISQFARHGARYCTSEYDAVHGWFAKASEAGVLTEAGKDLKKRYDAFYREAKYCKGNLTNIGKNQHRGIAGRMVERYPSVFEGPTHVEAFSTESPRVIMSMWSCLSGLQEKDADIDIQADASGKFAPWLQPALKTNPYYIKNGFSKGEAAEKAYNDWFEKTVPWKEIVGRFFTDADALGSVLKVTPEQFIDNLQAVVADTKYCLDDKRDSFDGVFTPDELYSIWEALSAKYFTGIANYEVSESLIMDYAAFTLGQMIESADADIASGNTQLRLRFGHDSGIAPLMVLLDANGFGRATSSLEECLEIFPSYNLPMAASVQLVLYKKEGADILVKALINEQEAVLPFEAVQGPYYRWEDFKEHYMPGIRASRRKIKYYKPTTILKSTDWGWKPVNGSKVEVGHASVKVFNSVQDISLARFPMKSHSVSVVESDGPKAAITSKLAADNKALAAINGSYFNTKELIPVTYVKDEGKVLCDKTSDGVSRCNGMFRIQDRRGRKVDIVSIDSLSTAKSAKGWREAIVSGPVLLEEGVAPDYPMELVGRRNYRKFYAKRHPRTLIGYTADGWIYFIVIDGRFPGQGEGMTISELQVLCESLGMYEALNLDGGGSSALWSAQDGVINHPYDNKVFDHAGERVVPNVIIVK